MIGKASLAAHLDFIRRVQIQCVRAFACPVRSAPRALRMPMTLFLFLIKKGDPEGDTACARASQ